MKILLLIFLLLNLLLPKKPSNYLYCGIFAWIGDSPKKFSWDKFNLLGVLNDTRGGDSCGRVVNGEALIGLHKEKEYVKLIQAYHNTPVKEPIVLGHTRKASWGYAVNFKNAQPIVIEKDGEVEFILTHNGTIHNAPELREKYPIDLEYGKTDSYILAHIIYQYGFEVLNYYFGTAALVIYDRRKYLTDGDIVMHLFRGKSKATYHSTVDSSERPLHIFEKKNNTAWVSSEEYPLIAIDADPDDVSTIEPNKVYTVVNGVVQYDNLIDVDRSKVGQYKGVLPLESSKKKTQNWEAVDDVDDNANYAAGFVGGGCDNGFSANTAMDTDFYYQMSNEKIYPYEEESDVILFKRGRYYTRGELADGIVHIDIERKFYKLPQTVGAKTVPFYFIQGVLMRNFEDYQRALVGYKNISYSEQKGMRGLNILARYATYPLWMKVGSVGCVRYFNNSTKKVEPYTGRLNPAFSKMHYTVDKGNIVKNKPIGIGDIWYPDALTKLLTTQGSVEEPFQESEDYTFITPDIVKIEIAHELGEVLNQLTVSKERIAALGTGVVDIENTVKNLDEIISVLTTEDDRFFNKQLEINPKWED